MSAMSGLKEKIILAPFGVFPSHFCPCTGKIKKYKMLLIFLGGPKGPIHPVWALAAIHPRWGRYVFVGIALAELA